MSLDHNAILADLFQEAFEGRPPGQQTFSDPEWDELRASLKEEYQGVLAFFESNPQWPSQDWLIGGMALLPHMAYHAGAVRQLKAVVTSA